MAETKHALVILRRSGKPWRLNSGIGGQDYWMDANDLEAAYFQILAQVRTEMQSAGGNWDAPWQLLVDGAVRVDSKLADIAWTWGQDLQAREAGAREMARANHTPAWLLEANR